MPTITEPKFFRATGAMGTTQSQVERDGGMFGQGLIRNVSVITRGEALGHEIWVDHEFLGEVAEAITATGVKARFTHPGLSSDGVGQKLGKLTDAIVDGDQVLADLHFQEAATKTVDGDLADYVMSLAEETPEDFGLSIVFEHDIESMNEHLAENTITHAGREIYTSPDELNKDNYPHARLARLRAGDVVDSPAANPDGLFQRGQEAAKDGEDLLSYALGLVDAKPLSSRFNVDGDRAKQFLSRFLSRHKLEIMKKGGDQVSDTNTNETAVDAPPTREQFTAELQRYQEAFGVVNGGAWFAEGLDFSGAQAKHIDELTRENVALRAELDQEKEKVKSLDRGEDEGPEFNNTPAKKPKTFNSRIRIAGKSYSDN